MPSTPTPTRSVIPLSPVPSDQAPGPSDGFVRLLTLSDDELLSLGTDHRGLVWSPATGGLSAGVRDAVWASARRGLVARGLLVDLRRDALRHPDLEALLTVRDNSESVMVIQRTLAGPRVDLRYCHLAAETVLIEDVTADGLHHFSVGERASMAGMLAGFLVPTGAADGHQGWRLAPSEFCPDDLTTPNGPLRLLAEAKVTADIVVRSLHEPDPGSNRASGLGSVRGSARRPIPPRSPELIGVFLGPTGCYLSRAEPTGDVVFSPLRVAEVGHSLAALLPDPPTVWAEPEQLRPQCDPPPRPQLDPAQARPQVCPTPPEPG